MNEHSQRPGADGLTAEQAADVILYFDAWENGKARENRWPDKTPLAQVAIRASLPSHSILPDKKPMLSHAEMKEGLQYIENEREIQERLRDYMSTPAHTDEYRDVRERAAGEHLD